MPEEQFCQTTMTAPRKQPTTWDEYEGTHRGSFGSATSIQWNDDDERPARAESSGFAHQLRERRYRSSTTAIVRACPLIG